MQVVYGHHNAPAWRGAAVAIGNFDGVHLGHRALIARARELAAASDALTVALTFDPHPSALLAPARAPRLLTSIERRIELLAGVAPSAFVDDVVIFALRARAIVVGYDFRFGQGRTGTVEALRAHGIHAG